MSSWYWNEAPLIKGASVHFIAMELVFVCWTSIGPGGLGTEGEGDTHHVWLKYLGLRYCTTASSVTKNDTILSPFLFLQSNHLVFFYFLSLIHPPPTGVSVLEPIPAFLRQRLGAQVAILSQGKHRETNNCAHSHRQTTTNEPTMHRHRNIQTLTNKATGRNQTHNLITVRSQTTHADALLISVAFN